MTLTSSDSSETYTTPVLKLNQPDDTFKSLPLPKPPGAYPYHLYLKEILPTANDQYMTFHMVGDTGSVRNPGFLPVVSEAMTGQYQTAIQTERPQFLYHLGDVVYNYGEAEHYPEQFFTPYSHYPGPIMAIAGNHDSDVNPYNPVPYHSLDAFTAVFCDTISQPVIFSGKTERKSMIQPNVYWTLETPLATIIGLHSNVPKYGYITAEQRQWFIEELKAADLQRPNKALIVCVHHAPYSADANHGSSLFMIDFLENVFEETGILPDIVFSGHVHNYQRFSKSYTGGKTVPYIVAGAGGFDELHSIAVTNDERFINNHPLLDKVILEHYCDNKYGFLKIKIERNTTGISLTGEYYTINHNEIAGKTTVELEDSFTISI